MKLALAPHSSAWNFGYESPVRSILGHQKGHLQRCFPAYGTTDYGGSGRAARERLTHGEQRLLRFRIQRRWFAPGIA
jgi:hypothetical protein